VEFQDRFPDEHACWAYLMECRWPEGYRCPRCGCASAALLAGRRLWQCSACRYQVSVTAGTVLHKTHTPLHMWFWAAYLMGTPTPGVSALRLQRQLGLRRYGTAWTMLHKLRRAMVNPERQHLIGEVEVDECFVGGHEAGLRGGRARGEKALVAVGVEVRGAGSGRVRMAVIDDASAATLSGFVRENVALGSTVHTDAWKGYRTLGKLGYDHQPRSQRAARAHGEDIDKILPRVHRVISNLKELAARHPSWRLGRALAGLPRRAHLPLQPPTNADGHVPDAARSPEPAAAHHLPKHRGGRFGRHQPGGANRISMTVVIRGLVAGTEARRPNVMGGA
jgi:hypothetical protein